MGIHESGEMYLETIYVLQKKHSAVRSVDISEHMGYSKPSVSRAVGLLKKGGYIQVDQEGYITLTDTGLAVAEKIYQRHTVLSRMLTVPGFSLLLSGGIAYTVGAVLYGIGAKIHWMHSIFHIFVVIGSLLQFLAIYLYIL